MLSYEYLIGQMSTPNVQTVFLIRIDSNVILITIDSQLLFPVGIQPCVKKEEESKLTVAKKMHTHCVL